MSTVKIGNRLVGDDYPTYTIADIASNHDGSLERARMLIRLAAESGADAAKFQLFSGHGISSIQNPLHKVYMDNAMPRSWIPHLFAECVAAGVDFLCTPYDYEAVELLSMYVPAFKVGSGDITWLPFIEHVASYGKPVILSTGASSIGEVAQAVKAVGKTPLVLLQCGMEYSGSEENVKYANLRVLSAYRTLFDNGVCGLSDHTQGTAVIAAAVALGAGVIERHFTDDTTRSGPDHHFALDAKGWRRMVDTICDVRLALGNSFKQVEPNEREWQVVARRCVRASRDIAEGEMLTSDDVEALRPCDVLAIPASEIEDTWGHYAREPIERGQSIKWTMLR